MSLARILEPEVMDSHQEAIDYDAIDNHEVNEQLCIDALAAAPSPRRVLDLGTGTALIPIALCRRSAGARVVAVDMAEAMLTLARRNVERAGLPDRIELVRRDLKYTGFPEASFDLVLSNSVVHHVPTPLEALAEMVRVTAPGGVVFVRDLARPADRDELERLVELHAAVPAHASREQRAMYLRQRELFAASLHAGLTAEEVEELVRTLPLASHEVRRTSDRHWTLVGRR